PARAEPCGGAGGGRDGGCGFADGSGGGGQLRGAVPQPRTRRRVGDCGRAWRGVAVGPGGLVGGGSAVSQVLRVDPQVLREHATAVGRLAQEVASARAAGAHVVMGREAFGQLCQFLSEMLEQTTTAAVDTLAAAADAARETAL